MTLNDEDIAIIQKNWKIPQKSLANSGCVILTAYFQKFPDHIKKFEKFKEIPLVELKETDKFKNHALKIMESFDKSITALGSSDLDTINDIWSELGGLHFRKKIPQPYFDDLKGVIFEILGPLCKMNARDVEAWNKLFDTIYGILLNRMDELEAEA